MENQTRTSIESGQTPTQEVPKKPSKFQLTAILGILVLVLIGLNGYLFYQNQQLKKELVKYLPTPTPSSVETPVPTPESTDSWKTYENLKYKFSFKYLEGLNISESLQGKGQTIKINGLSQQISLTIDPISEHDFFQGKTTANTYTFNNIIWKHLTGNEQYCDGGECSKISDVLQTSNNNYRYTIVLGDLIYPDETLNQILATFKFIDKSEKLTKKMGFIKSINNSLLSVDYIDWIEDKNSPNQFRISNPEITFSNLNLSPNVKISIISEIHQTDKNILILSEFNTLRDTRQELLSTPFWIEIENNLVTKITEQFVP